MQKARDQIDFPYKRFNDACPWNLVTRATPAGHSIGASTPKFGGFVHKSNSNRASKSNSSHNLQIEAFKTNLQAHLQKIEVQN
jgi:hypothetical protein